MMSVRKLIVGCLPETAPWHASKPVYWLLAYVYNTNSDGDGYIRYRPGELELVDADEEPTEREMGWVEAVFEITPLLAYMFGIALVALLLPGIAGFTVVMILAVLALAALDQLGEMTLTVTTREVGQ